MSHLSHDGDSAHEANQGEWRARALQADAQLREREQQVRRLSAAITANRNTLNAVLTSKGWRLLNLGRSVRDALEARLGVMHFGRNRLVIDASTYRRWIAEVEQPQAAHDQLENQARQFVNPPLISVLMAVYNPPAAFLERAIGSVREQIYRRWELRICDDGSNAPHVRPILEKHAQQDPRVRITYLPKNRGISAASNAALSPAAGEFVGLLDHDDELSPDALFQVVRLLQQKPEADAIYSDEDKLDSRGRRCDPFFKPDWSPEYLLSCMYTCHFTVYRKAQVVAAGGFRAGFEGSQDYDLMLRISERTQNIFHIPRVLYHWRKAPGSTAARGSAKRCSSAAGQRALQEHMQRRGVLALVTEQSPNRYRVRPLLQGRPQVSILIPTRDRARLLQACVRSIEEKTEYKNYEIIIADNGTTEPEARSFLDSLSHRVISVCGDFNFSRLNNEAARHAQGDYLVLLNNDTRIITPGWLDAMLEWCQLPEIGIAGCKLLYPNGTVQHAGVVLGMLGVAGHCYQGLPAKHQGYFYSLSLTRNYSAVTAACMMIRRNVFDQVNGLEEELPVNYGDVDLCLRVLQAGYRVVYTPYAEVYHDESASRPRRLDAQDILALQLRWGDRLLSDPYYNPNLSLLKDYRLDVGGR